VSLLHIFNRHPSSERTDGRSNLNGQTLLGVYRPTDPEAALGYLNNNLTWHDPYLALSGKPVWSDSSGHVVVSGEITLDNADELRQRLDTPETEDGVLFAELWRQFGLDSGIHALGMYALAIYEPRKRELTLVRDGVGAKTMYYAEKGQTLWFSTRLQPLRQSISGDSDLSLTALCKYLTFSYVPGDETMWRDIRELRPGTARVVSNNHFHTYWEPREGEWDPADSIDDHGERLHDLVQDAVRERLPAESPVGIYLSGGIDSSLVVAIAAKLTSYPVHTYALDFGPDYPSELTYANLVADHCRTKQHILTISSDQIRDHIYDTMAALDDPIGDPLTVPNYLLGKIAAQDTGVVLNGEGGDPCFGGPKNQVLLLHELYSPTCSREEAYLRSYRKCYEELSILLTLDVQEKLKFEEPQEALLIDFFGDRSMSSFLNKLMHINVSYKGADHILTKVNNLTTANNLSGRSPLFDRRVVDMSFSIPPAYKVQGTNEKAVLKRAAKDLLPDVILNRPKSGMQVPVQRWFRKDLRRFARGLLLNRQARIRPYIDQSVVKQWLNYEGSVWPRYGSKIWLLLSLEIWLQTHE
jgi:asparagine synthase (glutamine-hydrolysing)